MIDHRNHKKKLIVSYKNLPEKVKELFKETYPEGHREHLQKTVKPNGEAIFVVPLETDDATYMVKFDVVYDTTFVEEDIEKDTYGDDDEQGDSSMTSLNEVTDKEEGNNDHHVGVLQHGSYDEMFEGLPEDKREFEMADDDLDDDYDDQPDGKDSYLDGDDEEEDDEPNDDELLDIENLLAGSVDEEGMLRDELALSDSSSKKKISRKESAIKAVKSEMVKASKKQTSEKRPKTSSKTDTAPAKSRKTTKTSSATKSTTKSAKQTTTKSKTASRKKEQ